jgi:hypothetical protein
MDEALLGLCEAFGDLTKDRHKIVPLGREVTFEPRVEVLKRGPRVAELGAGAGPPAGPGHHSLHATLPRLKSRNAWIAWIA